MRHQGVVTHRRPAVRGAGVRGCLRLVSASHDPGRRAVRVVCGHLGPWRCFAERGGVSWEQAEGRMTGTLPRRWTPLGPRTVLASATPSPCCAPGPGARPCRKRFRHRREPRAPPSCPRHCATQGMVGTSGFKSVLGPSVTGRYCPAAS